MGPFGEAVLVGLHAFNCSLKVEGRAFAQRGLKVVLGVFLAVLWV